MYRAVHKTTGRIVAIKLIPVETDLNDQLKELIVIKSCKSSYIVRYYGSYYKDNVLWVNTRERSNG